MAEGFSNVVDYVRTQLDTFEHRDLCRVDSLVFSCLSYFRLPMEEVDAAGDKGMCLRDFFRAEWFEAMCAPVYDPAGSVDLLCAVAASPRFRDVRVSDYVSRVNERAEQQFSAMTFHLSPTDTFVAFRGTDNTLVGWKEDFNMSFQTTVPSQVAAARYVEHVAARTQGRIWCGGHSKGGNLAVYAAVMGDPTTRERIVRCFSHDGPGFSATTMADDRWQHMDDLVDKTIPQSSVIGMIFEQQENDYLVVHSDSRGFTQHDPFSWEVDGCDFALEDKIGVSASWLNSTVNEWLSTTSTQERERFVDAIFSVIDASGYDTMGDIRRNVRVAAPRMIAAAAALDPSDRQIVMAALGDVVRAMAPSLSVNELAEGLQRHPEA